MINSTKYDLNNFFNIKKKIIDNSNEEEQKSSSESEEEASEDKETDKNKGEVESENDDSEQEGDDLFSEDVEESGSDEKTSDVTETSTSSTTTSTGNISKTIDTKYLSGFNFKLSAVQKKEYFSNRFNELISYLKNTINVVSKISLFTKDISEEVKKKFDTCNDDLKGNLKNLEDFMSLNFVIENDFDKLNSLLIISNNNFTNNLKLIKEYSKVKKKEI